MLTCENNSFKEGYRKGRYSGFRDGKKYMAYRMLIDLKGAFKECGIDYDKVVESMNNERKETEE